MTGDQLKQVEARMEGALEVGLREQFHEFIGVMKRGDAMKGKVSAGYEEKVNEQISAVFGRGKGKMMTLADMERVMGQMRRLEDWKAKVERELDAADVAVKHLQAQDDLRQAQDDLPW